MNRLMIKRPPVSDREVLFFCLMALLCFWMPSVSAKEQVHVYTYHKMPPHVVSFEEEEGLFFDCLDGLQQDSKFEFILKYLPRKRLNTYLDNNELRGVVIGVNPAWFRDKARQKYLWTPPLFHDRDEIVSNINSPVQYSDSNSLKGLKLCGVSGFYYHGIDQKAESKGVQRLDSDSEVKCLHKVINGSIDFTIASTYTVNYLRQKNNWQEVLFVSDKPHDQYGRHILVPHSLKSVYDFLVPRIEGNSCNVQSRLDTKMKIFDEANSSSKQRM